MHGRLEHARIGIVVLKSPMLLLARGLISYALIFFVNKIELTRLSNVLLSNEASYYVAR